ncbi:MAG: hypothetical protein Q7R39_01320 [Dehalococcoidia bacterium]|nr:hypothetical protein [Dehalococcoidia bacterium]
MANDWRTVRAGRLERLTANAVKALPSVSPSGETLAAKHSAELAAFAARFAKVGGDKRAIGALRSFATASKAHAPSTVQIDREAHAIGKVPLAAIEGPIASGRTRNVRPAHASKVRPQTRDLPAHNGRMAMRPKSFATSAPHTWEGGHKAK